MIKDYNIFILLGNTVYDSIKLFELYGEFSINLLTFIKLKAHIEIVLPSLLELTKLFVKALQTYYSC